MEQQLPAGDLDPFERELATTLDVFPSVERTSRDGTLHETRRFRGLTLEQTVRYLESLGGTRTGDTAIEGDGWQATLERDTVPVGPSFRVTEVTLSCTGDPAVVEPLVLHFCLMAFRAPA